MQGAHGLKGELLCVLFSKDYETWKNIKQFYLSKEEGESCLVEISSVRLSSRGMIVSIKELKDRTHAELYRGWFIGIPTQWFESRNGERLFLREIRGFQLWNNGALVGEISGFSSNGPQDLLLVQGTSPQAERARLAEVPFVEDFIEEVNFNLREVRMKLPEGLLEINEN